ncbi:unnamed protein product [Pneumocystis jirovecii]|uniref:Uncharacterized protein n=1 Tax=Pneumocystis jirovecii TaxID=42068 RepID=L0P7A8_PNEJI|nr:unnamed protein product [Pneumocystis jirovecii]
MADDCPKEKPVFVLFPNSKPTISNGDTANLIPLSGVHEKSDELVFFVVDPKLKIGVEFVLFEIFVSIFGVEVILNKFLLLSTLLFASNKKGFCSVLFVSEFFDSEILEKRGKLGVFVINEVDEFFVSRFDESSIFD